MIYLLKNIKDSIIFIIEVSYEKEFIDGGRDNSYYRYISS